jgi:hypothetical protein
MRALEASQLADIGNHNARGTGLEACADEYLPRSNQALASVPSVRIRHGPPSLSSPNLVGPKEPPKILVRYSELE